MLIHEQLARMVAAEEVSCHFTLLGDANMYFADSLDTLGVRSIHVRHEHCACSMAMSYARATGDIGFCSVTCGPGLTQLATALPAAVRASIPMVVFAGESPLNKAWYNQQLEQAPLVRALGVDYIPIHTRSQIAGKLREAFLSARLHQKPVVVGIPMDLQHMEWTGGDDYAPSHRIIPKTAPLHPAPEAIAEAAQLIRNANKIVLVAGKGAMKAGAADTCMQLADQCGALLATTLPVRGLFLAHPFDLGVAGGFSSPLARELFAEADLVIAVGASLTQHMRDADKLFGQAKVLQIDLAPTGINQGAVVAEHFLRGDAKVCAERLAEHIAEKSNWRSDDLRTRIASAPADSTEFPDDGYLDPRDVIAGLQEVLPKSWEMVNSSGHCSYFSAQMRGWHAQNFHVIREFGAIGNGLSYAIGVAAARPDNTVVLIDGDGSLLMHAQELETIRRHGLKILICILNDGAYGSEIHKLRSEGLRDGGAVHGRGDLGAVARGFGLGGKVFGDLSTLADDLKQFNEGSGSALWDFHISDLVSSPIMRQNHPTKPHS
ncbi:thiamine pyrophosphate-binding protein [Pseudohalocynthiibacter aestuariivivens]|nr:thiamine pyrophosphate-binding protein [Pseudohalocynthiibacter aestuariivivens]QIE46851.1 thiamine pyrophosphate-binding protein [Pseudohalocynthiibacter aestuariivivens]